MRAAGTLLLSLALVACEAGEPTQILLTVQSDLVVSDDPALSEMDVVRIRALRYEPSVTPSPDDEDRSFPPPVHMEPGTPVSVDARAYTFRWAHDFPVSARTLPIEVGMAPEGGDANRVALFEAYALRAGEVVVAARVRVGYVRGQVLRVLLTLNALCRDAECPSDQTCQDGECVPVGRTCLVGCDGGLDGRDAGPAPDAGPASDAGVGQDGGPGVDAGPECDPAACDDGNPCNGIEACVGGRCSPGVELGCDDGVACTVDSCGMVGCTHAPDDGACTAAAGGWCDARLGCQYPSCTSSTCVAGPCETAACASDVCVRATTCTAGQMCCAGACVTSGCNDGNPCTNDSCGASDCVHTPNANPCTDGRFCNGTDTCGSGSCSVHSGSPCASGTCIEATDSCVECTSDSDCGSVTYGTWSGCDWLNACDEDAERTRTVTTPRCEMSSCTTTTTTETMVCMRDTDGAWCSSTPNSFGPWSACSYASACDEAGTRSRMVTRRRCVTGGCGTMTQTETETGGACARDTDGTPCDDGDVCSDSDQCVSGVCFGLRCGPGSCPPRFIASCTASGCECIPIDE